MPGRRTHARRPGEIGTVTVNVIENNGRQDRRISGGSAEG
jgi:hypothetical protein